MSVLSKYARIFLTLVVVFGSLLYQNSHVIPLSAQASTGQSIEQQINITNQEYSTFDRLQPGDNSLGLVLYDPIFYTNPEVYFEAVVKCEQCAGGDEEVEVELVDSTGRLVVGSISTELGFYTRVRSSELSLDAGEYTVRVSRNAQSGTAYLGQARMIVVQRSENVIDDTVSYFELGSASNVGTSVENGSYVLRRNESEGLIQLDSTYDLERTFVLCSSISEDRSPAGGQVSCELDSQNTLAVRRFDRSGDTARVEYQVFSSPHISVQRGVESLRLGQSDSGVVTLDAPVSVDRSFVLQSSHCDADSEVDGACGYVTADLVSAGQGIRLNRSNDTGVADVVWTVVEFLNGTQVQKFSTLMGVPFSESEDNDTKNLPIDGVASDRSFIVGAIRAESADFVNVPSWQLSDGGFRCTSTCDEVELTRSGYANSNTSVVGYVVTFPETGIEQVQHVVVDLAENESEVELPQNIPGIVGGSFHVSGQSRDENVYTSFNLEQRAITYEHTSEEDTTAVLSYISLIPSWQNIPNAKQYRFSRNNFDDTIQVTLEATARSVSGGGFQLRLFNLDTGRAINSSTITIQGDDWVRRQSINIGTSEMPDGRYVVQSNSAIGQRVQLANAKLAILQDGEGDGLGKTELAHYVATDPARIMSRTASVVEGEQLLSLTNFVGGSTKIYLEAVANTSSGRSSGNIGLSIGTQESQITVSSDEPTLYRSSELYSSFEKDDVELQIEAFVDSAGYLEQYGAWLVMHINFGIPELVMHNFRWYVDDGSMNPQDPWGGMDLPENTSITLFPAIADPPHSGQPLHLRVNVSSSVDVGQDELQFLLQYKKGTDGNCTTGSWEDVALGNAWEPVVDSLTSGVLSPLLTTSDKSVTSNVEVPSSLNANPMLADEEVEYGFRIIGSNSSDATQYSFRVVTQSGQLLEEYSNCPTLVTEPNTGTLLRHGNFFGEDAEQGFFWAD